MTERGQKYLADVAQAIELINQFVESVKIIRNTQVI